MKYYSDDRPKWSGPKEKQTAKWRGMSLEVIKLNEVLVEGWAEQRWRFLVTGGNIMSKYSNIVEYEDDAKHCAEGAGRDYSNGSRKEM